MNGEFDQIATAQPLGGEIFLGVDIGTTSISAALVGDGDSRTFSIPNACRGKWDGVVREQNSRALCLRVREFVDAILARFPNVRAIGLDGQMHGVVYVDGDGMPISELITWQDARADVKIDGESACDVIRRVTDHPAYAGYGLATHLANIRSGRVPVGAAKLCTIADLVAMDLCGVAEPVVHTTNAASLGLFDTPHARFDVDACAACGVDPAILPRVTDDVGIVGEYRGIPVLCAVGDNQAAYRGVMPNGGVLCNFGTGSQLSVAVDDFCDIAGIECRPYFDGKYLLSGSALCGGRAYALLEKFFRTYTGADNEYERLDALCAEGYADGGALDVSTLFCGTRENPELRGSITGIDENNFTPQALAYGFVRGMVNELHDFFVTAGLPSPKTVTASGNAVRKSPVLQKVISDIFGAPVRVSQTREEAACGAASLAKEICSKP